MGMANMLDQIMQYTGIYNTAPRMLPCSGQMYQNNVQPYIFGHTVSESLVPAIYYPQYQAPIRNAYVGPYGYDQDIMLAPPNKIKLVEMDENNKENPKEKNYCCIHTTDQSDFVSVCREDITHLLIFYSQKYCPKNYNGMITGVLYSYNKEVAVPVLTALLKDEEYQTIAESISEFHALLSASKLRPTYITCPFDPEIFRACTLTFSKSAFIGSFYYYNQSLFKSVYRIGIHKEMKSEVYQLIFKLMSLAFLGTENINEEYNKLRDIYEKRTMTQIFPSVLEFLEEYKGCFLEGACKITEWTLGKFTTDKSQYTTPVTIAANLIKQHLLMVEKAWNSCMEKHKEDDIITKIIDEYKEAISQRIKFPCEYDELLAYFLKGPQQTFGTACGGYNFIQYSETGYLIGLDINLSEFNTNNNNDILKIDKKVDEIKENQDSNKNAENIEYEKQLSEFKGSLKNYFDKELKSESLSKSSISTVKTDDRSENESSENDKKSVVEYTSSSASIINDSQEQMLLLKVFY